MCGLIYLTTRSAIWARPAVEGLVAKGNRTMSFCYEAGPFGYGCTAPGSLDKRLAYAARLKGWSCQAARASSGLRWPFFSIRPFGVVAGGEGADGASDVVDGLEDTSVHDLP